MNLRNVGILPQHYTALQSEDGGIEIHRRENPKSLLYIWILEGPGSNTSHCTGYSRSMSRGSPQLLQQTASFYIVPYWTYRFHYNLRIWNSVIK